ncbi:MAG: TIGR04053 family radical SAM/SPASM domain-containing protein [Polyangiaceae bacterium]
MHLDSPVSDVRRHPTPFDDHPLLVIWELTQACDLACVHCRASAVPSRDPRELDTAEGKRLLDSVAEMKTPLVVFTGGDPAKRDDLAELVRYGASLGLIMAVTPSGTGLFTGERLRELKDAGLARLAVSIDGPDATSHDAFRRVPGSFAHTLRILEEARALGIERQINTTIGAHNVERLDELAKLVGDVGAVLWSVFALVPTGRADEEQLISPERLEEALITLATMAEKAPFDIKSTAAPMYRRVLMERHAKVGPIGVIRDVDAEGNVKGPRGINDGVGMVFVSHRGDVYPSGFLPIRVGNVRETALPTLYRQSPLMKTLRDPDALTGKCGACPFKVVCGGSRARAFAMTGDPSGYDPSCAYVPRGFQPAEA